MSFLKQEKTEYNVNSKNIGDGNHGDYGQHSNQSSQASITAFLAKLWALVNDSSCDDLIAWDPSGGSFHVFDQARFAREILPRYFKHNNFASFIRQLNMYGFRKMSTIEHGSLKTERDDIEFAHPYFIRGQEPLLEFIKRRAPDNQQKSNSQGGSEPSPTQAPKAYTDSKSNHPVELVRLLEDVKGLHTKQTSLNDKLSYMETENEALWSEIGSLRQKHAKQQQIVSKLMEFLVHFLTNNTSRPRISAPPVQPNPKVVDVNQFIDPEQVNNFGDPTNSQLIMNKHGLSSNALKRKQIALMLGEGPNKRTTSQQHQFLQPNNADRQQSITINELTDNDLGAWIQGTNTLPLVDLVPSPPPPPLAQSLDDNYQHQQPLNDYQWSNTTTNELLNPLSNDPRNLAVQNKTLPTMINEPNTAVTYVPDFVLRTDDINEKNKNIGSIHASNLTDMKAPHEGSIKTVSIPQLSKGDQLEFPNTFQPSPIDEPKPSPTLNATLYSQTSQEIKPDPPCEQISFSLDDITGDVDQIQSSLDNIRELMFETLPDGTSIEDLFGEENGLLSPLLQSVTHDNQTDNTILTNLPNPKLLNDNNNNLSQCETTIQPQPIPNVTDQLLEQLITETAKVEEQRNTIEQLEREKSDLTDKLRRLEKQTNRRK